MSKITVSLAAEGASTKERHKKIETLMQVWKECGFTKLPFTKFALYRNRACLSIQSFMSV
jgi:hypothetical protein